LVELNPARDADEIARVKDFSSLLGAVRLGDLICA